MQRGKASTTYRLSIRASDLNTGTIARQSLFPIIQAKCQAQIDKLNRAGDQFSLKKATQIRLAVERLDNLITLKERISQSGVSEVDQQNGGENLRKLARADFSDLGTLLSYQSENWIWFGPMPGYHNVIDYKDEYDNSPVDKFPRLHSIQDAVNISFSNIFNLGFFKMNAYYGPMWGKTDMLAEFETEMAASTSTPSL